MKQLNLVSLLVLLIIISTSVSAQEIDFHFGDEKHLRLPVMVNGQGPFDFILDTAASRTIITQPLVAEMRLEPIVEYENNVVHGTTGSASIKRYPSLTLDLGGQYVWKTGIIPALNALTTDGKPFYGILGSDFFQAGGQIEIDAAAGKLRIGHAVQSLNDATAKAIPIFEIAHGIWGFDASINNTAVTALLDTGARQSIINTNALPDLIEMLPVENVEGASGHTAPAAQATGLDIAVDDLTWLDRSISVSDLHIFNQLNIADQPAMIFASDLLFEYTLVIDYSGQRMWLAPSA